MPGGVKLALVVIGHRGRLGCPLAELLRLKVTAFKGRAWKLPGQREMNMPQMAEVFFGAGARQHRDEVHIAQLWIERAQRDGPMQIEAAEQTRQRFISLPDIGIEQLS